MGFEVKKSQIKLSDPIKGIRRIPDNVSLIHKSGSGNKTNDLGRENERGNRKIKMKKLAKKGWVFFYNPFK